MIQSFFAVMAVVALLPVGLRAAEQGEVRDWRKSLKSLETRGLWRELVDHYKEHLQTVADGYSGDDFKVATLALRRLGAVKEWDALVESSVAAQPQNPVLLLEAGLGYRTVPHGGRLVAGEFERANRGNYHGGRPRLDGPDAASGRLVLTDFRDRVRSLQLLRLALQASSQPAEQAEIWREMANAFPARRDTWKLQTLTPLDALPAWDEPGPEGGTEGAAWTAQGPLLYSIPSTWETAKSDGERWRFALAERARLAPATAVTVALLLAQFSESQFGTETLSSFGWWRQMDPDQAKGILEMDTLAEDECLAQTSSGVRRFKLPAEFHFIAIYRSILPKSEDAGDSLTEVFLNRRQYHKAREVLEQTIAHHGPGDENRRKTLLHQITGNWGRFQSAETTPAGTRPKIPLVFRNATSIALTAAPVDMEAVLQETIAYIKSNPKEIDWEQRTPAMIAQRLIRENTSQFIGKTTASWETSLNPREHHRDTRTELEVPLDRPGAWWITGTMTNGNSFHTLVWIVDSVLVHHDVNGNVQWWLADAASGKPIAQANLEFFGFRVEEIDRKTPLGRRTDVKWREFQRETDSEGKTLLKPGQWDPQYEWLTTARAPGKATAWIGFESIYAESPSSDEDSRDLAYGISDRPLYKPGDSVKLKFFLRNVGYFEPDDAKWAQRRGKLTVFNGRGEEAMTVENLRTDALGAVETEVMVPKDAPLGQWRAVFSIADEHNAIVTFGLEEYRKPEYEVTVEAPSEPVRLGETFSATVKATYFHGAPVRNASAEIIVKRKTPEAPWFPGWRWDWLYGAGAWWNGAEASWHPTWHRWGCVPPLPTWRHGSRWTPEELVMKQTVPIGPGGTARIEIDTAPAKEIHGDMDATYTIEARVTDASRREERGTSSVIAARRPFELVVWTQQGYAAPGAPVTARISASSLAGKPVVAAKGTLTLLKMSMVRDRIEEQEIQSWPVETDAKGEISHPFPAPVVGQYRLAARLTFRDGEPVESASILNVHGTGRDDPAAWQFGPLELIADQAEYAPGGTLKLRVNSDQPNACVWLFLHIKNQSARKAQLIRLDGKSREIELPLTTRDMPNFFIEGITVHGAKVHNAVKQILLPPTSKLLEVTLEPAKSRVKPKETSALRVTVRDAEGKPFSGTAVLAVYDQSLEALTGGSNVGPIHEAFWNWKNAFSPATSGNSLPSSPGNLLRKKSPDMRPLGRFGDDENAPFGEISALSSLSRGRGVGFGSGSGGGMPMVMSSPAPMAAMVMEDSFSAGNRSGDFAVSKNSIDAVLNHPNRENSAPIAVRKDFADLLKWSGSIHTDAEGHAEIPLEFPDNLTTWKARLWTLGSGSRVGEGSAEIIASKDLLVRLQAPRFLVERDEAVLSAVVHNDLEAPKSVTVSLEMDGKSLEAIEGAAKTVEIAAKSEARIDWRVKAVAEGEATLRMKADAGDDGDAVERKLPVLVHGMVRQDAWSRTLEPKQTSTTLEVEVPEQRRADQSKLTVRFSPTIAGAVVDAIPYLANYPHGCTEQTLNRFVPAVVAQSMLRDLGLNFAEIRAKRSNLNPQELGDSATRAAQWRQWQENPVFDEAELAKMVATGVDKLMGMQNSDGGWGWFSGYGEASYPHTTAVVMHGLLTAKAHGAEIPKRMIQSGINWLVAHERRETAALQLYAKRQALREAGKKVPADDRYEKSRCDAEDAFVRLVLGEADQASKQMLDFLYRDRLALPVYAKCLLGLELHRTGDIPRRDEVLQVISQFRKRDAENQTCFLDLQNSGFWWCWYGSETEAHAWWLKLLTAAKPNDPDTRGLVKYLVNHRKHAAYWESTRDTALAVEALAAYFKTSGENQPDVEVEVLLDGKSLRKEHITRENLFNFAGTITLTGEAVTTGKHLIEFRKSGKGPLYANAYLEVFTLEDRLRPAGLEIKVRRMVSRLVPLEKETEVPDSAGLIAKQQVERFHREPLADGATIRSGDRLEVELVLESKNDYEYLLFSAPKPAGTEALEALSGYIPGGGISAYMEPRDQCIDFFIRSLPRGTHTLRHTLRAESPGIYKALPATATAMYAPELRGNSDDFLLRIDNGFFNGHSLK